MRILAFLLVCLAATAPRAETVEAVVLGSTIKLVVPEGFCVFDRGNAIENQIVSNMERAVATTNRVLAAFAACAQRDELRGGQRTVLDDFGSYMTPLRGSVLTMPPAEFARRMEEVFKSQGASIIKGAEEQMRDRIGAMELGVKVGEQKLIGVLRTDERATYLGVIQNLGLPNGQNKVQLALIATGLANARIISLNLYTRYGEGNAAAETTLKTLELSAGTYAATIAANGK
ncbi:MAG: hypothetical protein KIT16_15120 [Rhodospirillaceae bacterium]|nr:hypothetical protein [Rhodospirillaceae bacterium]